MIYVRAVHFAATIAAAGVAFFSVFIADPAFRSAAATAHAPARVRRQLAFIAWAALALAVVSGAAWLLFTAQAMSDRPLGEVLSEGIVPIVLMRTDFGRDWLVRLAVAGLLAAAFVPFLSARTAPSRRINGVVVILSAGLIGSLAWAGHAIGASGVVGIVHPAADVLHLIAAAAWLGTLVPLALLLTAAGRDAASFAIARAATLRFSSFGIASVATILVTGSINAYYLVGSISGLTATEYGHLLLVKIALFFAMVAVAAVNRLRLRPRLGGEAGAAAAQAALRSLRRNTLLEVTMGAAIIGIVAVLGVTPPGAHEGLMPHAMHHH
jgi:copper resistance protein D